MLWRDTNARYACCDEFDDFGTWGRHSKKAILSSYEHICRICTLRGPFWYLEGNLILQPCRIMKIYVLTKSIPVLRGRFRYYGVDSVTARSTCRYYGGLHFLAIMILPGKRNTGVKAFPRSEASPVLQSRFRYYGVDSDTTGSTLQYYEIDSGTTESIRILKIDHEMAESVHGTEKRAPRQFIRALRGAPHVFRRHQK